MNTLRLFVDVARCHSFSQAAAMHGVTQSAASQRIGALEKRLGVTLLDRSVRPLSLTDAGQRYRDGVEDVLRRYDRLERSIVAGAAEPSGTVRIAAIYSSGIDLLSRVRGGFEEEHPTVAVQIKYLKPDEVHEAVVEGSADVGILSYPDRFRKVRSIALRDEEMAVVCPPEHDLASRRAVEARDLDGHEMIGFDADLPVARRTAAYLREHGAAPRIVNSFDNLDTLKGAVAVTDSFAILPRRTVLREAAAGTLAVVSLMPRLVRPMGLIHRPHPGDATLPPAVSLFVDYLLEHAPEVPPPGEDATPPAPARVVDPKANAAAPRNGRAKTAPRRRPSVPAGARS